MIKAAFPYWGGRIAPVFDAAKQIIFVEAEAGTIVKEFRLNLPSDTPERKVMFLVKHGVGVLVCGAISRQMEELVSAYSIEVQPFRAGNLEEIISAWIEGQIEDDAYSMPGCCGRCGGGRGKGHCYGKNKGDF